MLHPKDRPEAVKNFAQAVATTCAELISTGGVSHASIAAALRIEANKIEISGPRAAMEASEREMVDIARKSHEFINTLIVAGVEERTAVTCMLNTLIERVVRTSGPAGAATWLQGMANFVGSNGGSYGLTAFSH